LEKTEKKRFARESNEVNFITRACFYSSYGFPSAFKIIIFFKKAFTALLGQSVSRVSKKIKFNLWKQDLAANFSILFEISWRAKVNNFHAKC